MSFTTENAIHDPLGINLHRQFQLLLSSVPAHSPYAVNLAKLKNASISTAKSELLAELSNLLAIPALTQIIAKLYRPLLLDLTARWLLDSKTQNVEDQLVALCFLLEVHEEIFPVLSRLLQNSFPNGLLAFITTAPSSLTFNITRLHRLLLAYYRILQANRELPSQSYWSLDPLSHLIWTPHLDNGVRLMAIRCYALQSGMGEAERLRIEMEVLGEPCGVDCQLDYGCEVDGTRKEVDGWVMPVIELRRIQEERDRIVTEPLDFYTREADVVDEGLQSSDLCSLIANVHGVLLLRSPGIQPSSFLVEVPSAINALRNLALYICLRVPTLLTSPPSSGKSLLLSHLAGILYPTEKNQIITIHLADTSLDPRALLGSYVSSPTTPGNFEWKEGVLVRSMREGKWVAFEDIDRGSNEVLGVIKPLIETLRVDKWVGGRAFLDIPGRGRLTAHENFMIFATRSVIPSSKGSFPPPTFFGAHKFHEMILHPQSTNELENIVAVRFPRLAGPAGKAIIFLWNALRALGSTASLRNIGLQDLQKFCARVERLLPTSYHPPMDIVNADEGQPLSLSNIFPNMTLREDMLLEARDVFFGAGASTTSAKSHIEAVTSTIADHLGIDVERRESVLNKRVPEFDLEKNVNGQVVAIHVGRTRLTCRANKSVFSPVSRPFAMHRPAIILLSRIATAVSLCEPVLLTGETGTGKTSIITHLASLLHRPLISLNLSHQTESSDLIGGLKPIDTRVPGSALQERYLNIFGATFSRKKNEKFETQVRKAVTEANWKRAVGLWRESGRLAKERIQAKQAAENNVDTTKGSESELPKKRRKVALTESSSLQAEWDTFLHDVEEFEVQHVHGKGKFAFGFVEGPLVKALRSGDWVLLDEINLASPETLECISGLLHGPTASITLTEHGSLEPIPRHPDFRLFACMNPATDVGKKDLPPNIRSRFTEMDVPSPDADKDTLLSIITKYIGQSALGDKGSIMNVAEFYSAVKFLAETRQIADGANHRPHYSMRTLARALTYAADTASTYSLKRAIWEGCLMAFTMVLDPPSAELVMALAQKHLLTGVRNPPSMLAKEPSIPHSRSANEYVKFGPFYLEKGSLPADPVEDYILTPSVETKLVDLARIILTRRFPVLIEGPTSSGKTSSVEYLAQKTGHRFVRINNHEHTDIQEYIGSYVSDPLTGKLVFKDGLLVQALRNGDWIVLDELNLAPTEVLEALNRLLDDNRELVIPETQEVVRPHPHFMLFATQNPPGLYAGRKILSRAFRNRFLEVHFQDVPQTELETILCQKCQIAPSYGKRIVAVFRELQKRRQSGRVFESKHGFATLRDLFRWAGRDAVGYQELAENGYMLLAERARKADDKVAVKEVIESIMGVKIDEAILYDFDRPGLDITSFIGCAIPRNPGIVWTKAMQRLYILVARALRFNEPVLLVGETGSGKTSVCQVYADSTSQHLHSLNCHQNTETADLIGGLRPVRNRSASEKEAFRDVSEILNEVGISNVDLTYDSLSTALNSVMHRVTEFPDHYQNRLRHAQHQLLRIQSIFEWYDGPLVKAMQKGDVFLLDEISLADDSVLERLNSVLEPGRTLVLAERGGVGTELPVICAAEPFKLIATMNPGGDYGKKELSPALRNRFTEIWVPHVDDRSDLELIVGSLWKHEALKIYTTPVLDFVDWFCNIVHDRSLMSLRDILAWVTFSNTVYQPDSPDVMSPVEIFHHAARMTYLDGFSSLPQLSVYSRAGLQQLKEAALAKLEALVHPSSPSAHLSIPTHDPSTHIQLGSFAIKRGKKPHLPQSFNFGAPTTQDNAMRVLRACQVSKPILLEGSPGVGKTSLITALANLTGHELCRINLSDQTDLIDLFGSDLPVEGGNPGEFAWKDAEFLKALQEGHWVLLDEMNLAPQAVLEGLNAILDHRGTVYIPELGRSFTRHPEFRIFAAQNPLGQGGGRKGLPKSFVNRFTKVYIEELSTNDLFLVCRNLFPHFEENILRTMIAFNMQLNEKVAVQHTFAREGSPWEFNLRDVIRWGTLLCTRDATEHPAVYLQSVYLHRFRSMEDRYQARLIFDKAFFVKMEHPQTQPALSISPEFIHIGHYLAKRENMAPHTRSGRVVKKHLLALESLGDCVSQSWLAILTGPKDSGKTTIVRVLASLAGNTLREISINHATDAMDIIGSFEQVDTHSRVVALAEEFLSLVEYELRTGLGSKQLEGLHGRVCALRQARDNPNSQASSSLLKFMSCMISDLQKENNSGYLSDLHGRLTALLAAQANVGRFEWIDGPLVQAMKHGHWLLMDGANLCSPSVLDRLNSLCEPNGYLTLSERGFVDGSVQYIKPHPNFRLFMSVDPQYGELSRAMRNRGIEVALITPQSSDDSHILKDYYRLPRCTSTTKGNMNIESVTFSTARRGIGSMVYQTQTSPISSGRTFDQDSAMSSLIDQAPLLVTAGPENSTDSSPTIFFLARTLTPAYVPHFLRYLGARSQRDVNTHGLTRGFIKRFPEDLFMRVLARFHKSYAMAKKIPLQLFSHQPVDFFLNFRFSEDGLLTKPTDHLTVLHVLDFLVYIFLDEQDANERRVHDNITSSSSAIVLKVIDTALTSISTISREQLNLLFTQDSAVVMEHLVVATTFLRYGQYLRKAIASPTAINFSALQAILKWMIDALKDSPDVFSPLATHVHELNHAVSLSSGLGLMEIWSTFFVNKAQDLRAIHRLESLAGNLRDTSTINVLRRQTLNVIALTTLPNFKEEHEVDSHELYAPLENYLVASQMKENSSNPHYIEPSSILVELGALASKESLSDPKTLLKSLELIIDLSCNDRHTTLLRLVPYQHLAWAIDSGKEILPFFVQAQIQWLESIWNVEIPETAIDGASMLLRPIYLYSTFALCNLDKVSIRNIIDHESSVERHVKKLLLYSTQNMERMDQLDLLLIKAILAITACFSNSFTEAIYDEIARSFLRYCGRLDDFLSRFLPLLERSSNLPFCSAVQTCLQAPLQHSKGLRDQPHSISLLGLMWIGVGRMTFDLFVPSAPIDPVAVQNCTLDRHRQDESTLASQRVLHAQLEDLCSGNTNNEVLDYLNMKIEDIRARLSDVPLLTTRNNVSRLHMYWSEVLQFYRNVLEPAKIEGLVIFLGSGDSMALLREQVVQESLVAFCQRLDVMYSEYSDLTSPLKLAILQVRLGLRLIAQSTAIPSSTSDPVYNLSSALVAFPSVNSSALFSPGYNTRTHQIGAFHYLLLSLSSAAFEKGIGLRDEQSVAIVDSLYEQALHLWLIDRAKEADAESASQSLYRRNALDHTFVTDAELEQQEFLALFPNFEDVLDSDGLKPQVKDARPSLLVQREDISRLVRIHYGITNPLIDDPLSAVKIFNADRRLAIKLLLHSRVEELESSLDTAGIPVMLSVLSDSLETPSTSNSTPPYNFYSDPNITEVRKAGTVVGALRLRLEAIAEEWPDQMVLHHLISRCDIILSFALNSPIAKVLSAVEQLLLQTEDWEMYSNKDNTLKLNQQAIIGLIVEWRRLELTCWQGLLESQARTFADDLSDWWFRIYDAIIRGALSASDQELAGSLGAVSQYLGTLIPLLDDFLSTSPIGQYHTRLRLMSSFKSYISRLGPWKSEHQNRTLNRAMCVLESTTRYWGIFEAKLSKHLSDQRAVLEKEIRDFIKLASWKDINVQALKASAQRTHHQLYKIIRKFRDVLRQPVVNHLRLQSSHDSEDTTSDTNVIVDDSQPNYSNLLEYDSSAILQHLIHLKRSFIRYSTLIDKRIKPFIRMNSAEALNGLAIDIIIASRQLSSVTIPSSLTPEKREKQRKSLLSRKRKALSDLLKELKRIGFSSNIKSEVLAQHTDSLWVREQPIMPEVMVIGKDAEKIENYFTRLLNLLPELRSSIASHHPDLSTRDLQRGASFVESAYSMAIDLRSRLANALLDFQKCAACFERLDALSAPAQILVFDKNLHDHVLKTTNTMCKLSSAMHEVRQGVVSFDKLYARNSSVILGEISEIISSGDELCRNLQVLETKLSSVPISVVLEYEEALISSGVNHISRVLNTLREWSNREHHLQYLLRPVETWLAGQELSSITRPTPVPAPENNAIGGLIDSFLLSVQTMVSKCPIEVEDISDDDHYVLKSHKNVREFTHILNIEAIHGHLKHIFSDVTFSQELQTILQKIMPFFDSYITLAKSQLTAHAQWCKNLFKLTYVLCSTMDRLCKEGFCLPSAENEKEVEGDTIESSDGVGLGEGQGGEDVSKEIEDESQVEGLKGDNETDEPRDKSKDSDAIEMSEDFGGDLEDMPGSENEAEGNSSEDEAEPDDKVEHLDASDPDAIDEKLWGDEQGPESSPEDEKTDKDHSKEQEGNSEITAKEGSSSTKEKQHKEENKGEPTSQEDERLPEGEDGEDNADDDHDPNISGAPMDDHVPEANTLDLPDNLDLGTDDAEVDGSTTSGEDEGMDIDEQPQSINDTDELPSKDDSQPYDEPETHHDNPVESDEPENAIKGENPPEDGPGTSEDLKEERVAPADVSSGNGTADSKESHDPVSGESTSNEKLGESKGIGGAQNDSMTQDQAADVSAESDDVQPQAEQSATQPNSAGPAQSSSQEGQPPNKSEAALTTNPLRTLGDAIKEVRQVFDEILGGQQQRPKEAVGTDGSQSQVEYLQPDDMDSDMQALGPAGEEQIAKLDQLHLIEEEPTTENPQVPMDIDMPPESQQQDRLLDKHDHQEPTSVDDVHMQAAVVRDSQDHLTSVETKFPTSDIRAEDHNAEFVEMQLKEWRAVEYPEEGAGHIWRLYESLTHDLAYALCEQLRLILEPTLATRLKGDYRTGKRLNMKKIISYIASDYTKDKIWLRRTKPSQREYQILIAVDDSRSMAESHSIHLAYETLALISKALSRLEAGDIAIAKFGESVDILHGFNEGPFTDQAGVKVLSAFRFDQKATNALSMVDTSLKVLEHARERYAVGSATASDLWQLEIIISDGMCQDHDKLRTVLRKAEEQRVMIVFIILDSLHSNASTSNNIPRNAEYGSILSMDKAEFKSVNGKMELQLQKYLDSFPFEYYVILRNVESLPEVLAGTLKQFFERISEE